MTLRNYARVYFAPAPLPRFDNRWLYGDLHYHSQGTDNEGEAAYNYRNVVRAMGAMGLDFVFATEHASSSGQWIDVDLNLDLLKEGIGNWLSGDVDPIEEDDAPKLGGVLRDMDARRYAFNHEKIYGTKGVNREASLQGAPGRLPQSYLSHKVVPQIFLGGELDAIPEAKASTLGPPPPPAPGPSPPAGISAAYQEWLRKKREYDDWRPLPLPYGNRQTFATDELVHPGNQPPALLFELLGDSYLIHDFQALDRYNFYGREHLVYFPASSALNLPSGESSFIPSYTSSYGGATRRLDVAHLGESPLLPEIERKGFAFAAHHLNPCQDCGRGPEGVPWTLDHMLLKAFRSPAILGLEFWNEDSRPPRVTSVQPHLLPG